VKETPRTPAGALLARLRESPTRWLWFGVGTGIFSGLAAALFFVALDTATRLSFADLARYAPPTPPGDQWLETAPPPAPPRRLLLVLLPALGGLVSGLLVFRFAPEAKGHGIDEMIRSFHRGQGMIRTRVPLVKGLATIATLATGGSAGKEGPIAQIGAGIGSFLAVRLGLSARDRRILLLAGAAGGLGAIFRAPLGSAITAIEILYREDFESDALIPCVISSVTAYVLFVTLIGGARIFAVPDLPLVMPREVPGFLLLALLTVPVGHLYIRLFYGMRDRLFGRLRLPRFALPMLGGLGVGAIGWFLPEVLGVGWGWIQQALDGRLAWQTMAFVAAGKIVATCLTIGSGASGGVFGPTLFIGGMMGGVVGFAGSALAPDLFPHPEAYVLVGMGSFFAGVASAPIGAMLMVAEMTGGYALLPPLMLASVVAILLMRHTSIYESQVDDQFQSPAHAGELTVNVLEEMRVADVFERSREIPVVPPDRGFQAVRDLVLASRDATVPVVAESGRLVGLITAEQIRPVMDETHLDRFVVAGDVAAPAVCVRPEDNLFHAHELFRASGCPKLPVVEPGDGPHPAIVGMLGYRDMMHAYGRELARRRVG
jgi:CIC family chloride channel protein